MRALARTIAGRPEQSSQEPERRRLLVGLSGSAGDGGREVVALVHRARFARGAKGEDPTCDVFLTVGVRRRFTIGWSSDREHTRSCCEPSRRPEHAPDAR